MMNILVTGGAGYIGSHTCIELLKAGYRVVVVDNFSNSKPAVMDRIAAISGKEVPCYLVDVCDEEGLDRIFNEHAVDAVLHFAGAKSVGESVAEPAKYYQNNVGGTLTLCRVMANHGVKRLVFSSTATVYSSNQPSPLGEHAALEAQHPYGRSKLMVENMLSDMTKADLGWQVAVLRYFNPVGAHESGRMGEDPQGIPNNLMPFVTQVAVGRHKLLRVFGSDYETPDGTCIRDYIHVTDLARGHVKSLERLTGKAAVRGLEAYNLGTGCGYSVLELIKAFTAATGAKVPFELVDRRPGDSAICYSDPQKAKDVLGWSPTKTLEDMCRDAWRWQCMNPQGYEEDEMDDE